MKTGGRRLVLLGSLLLGLASLSRAAQLEVSPGALSSAHRDVNGPLKCLECHEGGGATMSDNCRSCHLEIDWLVTNGRGLHGRQDLRECSSCHAEHAGSQVPLRHFPADEIEQFDHRRTGWNLAGKHAVVACHDCHKPSFQLSEAARLARRKDRASSFLGLEIGCAGCHQDVHRSESARECNQCHAPVGWKIGPDDFDHARTGYELTGRHSRLACLECHAAAGTGATEGSARIRRLALKRRHDECSDCHRDVHQGRAGPTCSRCHVTDGFRRTYQVAFDHDRTGFPLTAVHLEVRCEQCHRRDAAGENLLAGFETAGGGCRACHADAHGHDRTEFPLAGKHLEVRCEGCHRQDTAGQGPPLSLERAGEGCAACHADAHAGQLAELRGRTECASCHRVEGWQAVTFTVQEHTAAGFQLQGRHAVVECAACHGPERKGPALSRPLEALGQARFAFDLGEPGCDSCHFDPHDGRFSPGGDRAREEDCAACHGVESFRPSLIDPEAHRNFAFPLNGTHRTTSCDRCHGEIRAEAAESEPQPPPEPASLLFAAAGTCESCHQSKSPHGGQFAQPDGGGDCADCHSETSFKPADRFDHDRGTLFPLLGSHSGLECAQCHFENKKKKKRRSTNSVVVYRGTPNGCRDCHRKGVPAMPTNQ